MILKRRFNTCQILSLRQTNALFRPLSPFDPSSTMPTNSFLYEHVDDVEPLHLYRTGGYHPIQPGDRLDGRYRVVHKLGYGAYSTIWLARDDRQLRYVAVKVGTADSDEKEAEILSRIADLTGEAEGGENALVPPVLDRFSVSGPNGRHPCFVTTPARCSLADAKEASACGLFQLDVARSVAAQIATAVANTHDKGYVHGDLHLGNILLRLPSRLDRLSEEQLYSEFGSPDPEPVRMADGKPLAPGVPPLVFSPIWLGEASEKLTLSEARILVADFGVAFCPGQESRFESYTPLEIRPPEARFEPLKPLSFASDIWSLACTIWAILGQRPFLDTFLISQDDATRDQVDALGPLPPEWWEKWETRSHKFAANGKPKEGRLAWSWDQRFEDSIQEPRRDEGMETLGEGERDALFDMVRWMLAFRPEDRPSARQVLETAWMKNWAIPARDKTWE
ncbi:Serine/threonine-protein kinase SRPK [Colletotrichum tanaceti]|uniref:Serine/threonine-protein kinase SRPK n=1 Tax=Colletotrichum tanaceti TaxID=1306861 RepID=A0A4U6X1F3_9PEZI|nr:Serine/threonine-protein kinase SRPK [Colletotrichum tanaceti]TKW48733.1 Serine/threonine-protein kinase SRPK [Colletotrichum tanaceti]